MSGDVKPVEILCPDGTRLGGHWFRATGGARTGAAIINPATGVQARYYHRMARFLASEGFDVLTYDYRGIGLSRPDRLHGKPWRWHEWGTQDFEGAIRFAQGAAPGARLVAVGHSIGGFLIGYAESAPALDRAFMAGAQYAWLMDYAPRARAGFWLKWHVMMPLMTAAFGYFPGKRLGWLEDLPRGVAQDWSFRGPRFERTHPRHERPEVLRRFAAVRAPILSVAASDDPFATRPALKRALRYYRGAPRTAAILPPALFGEAAIGHFALFHERFRGSFWPGAAHWLKTGENPWPAQSFSPLDE